MPGQFQPTHRSSPAPRAQPAAPTSIAVIHGAHARHVHDRRGYHETPVSRGTVLFPEDHRHQARHVERRARRGDRSNQPDDPTERDICRRGGVPQDLFGPEAAERNDAADRQPSGERTSSTCRACTSSTRPCDACPVRDACRESRCPRRGTSALEESVCHHVEDRDRERTDAGGHEHEAELRNG